MDLAKAIHDLYPNSINIIIKENSTEVYDKDGNPITIDLDACTKKAEDDWAAEEYKFNRLREYPSWNSQLDYIYHNGIDKWKTDIVDPVKAKYPKPS